MKLKKLDYNEFRDKPGEWKLIDCTFGDINLIVGKNASGKTRTLNVIKTLSDLFSGERKNLYDGNFYQEFADSKPLVYVLQYSEGKLIKERLDIDSETLLERESSGEGHIYFAELEKKLRFQTSPDEVGAFVRRDSIQHPFLEPLYLWGKNLRRYDFGTQLGKDSLLVKIETEKERELNLKDTSRVVAIFNKGIEAYSDRFRESIIKDMARIGYDLEDIGIETPKGGIVINAPFQPLAIYIKEKDLVGNVSQLEISQGMFRALSIIIQINYSSFAGIPSCILIDDIGEGLDFERSTSLIKLMIDKAKKSSVQLIMTTNDRFVMNNVPLEYWIILHREGSKCKSFNYRNSKEMFEEFEQTGLNNFDLFSTNYYLKAK